MDLFNVKGKIAVVIGGAGGIGECLASGLSQYAAEVIIASRDYDSLVKVAEKIKSISGADVVPLRVDATDEDSMAALVSQVVKKFGSVDILVNAHGLNIKHEALNYPMDDWDRLFDISVKGLMVACKHFGAVMKEKGKGKIINVSSVREIRGHAGGNTGYCATKGAVGLLTKSLALEWAPYNIYVNAIGPSLIITAGTLHIQENPELAKTYAAKIPLGRLGTSEDLIGACIFLASEASDFITGQTIFIDGGLTAG